MIAVVIIFGLTAYMWINMGLSSGIKFFEYSDTPGFVRGLVVWPLFALVGPFGYMAVYLNRRSSASA